MPIKKRSNKGREHHNSRQNCTEQVNVSGTIGFWHRICSISSVVVHSWKQGHQIDEESEKHEDLNYHKDTILHDKQPQHGVLLFGQSLVHPSIVHQALGGQAYDGYKDGQAANNQGNQRDLVGTGLVVGKV